MARVLLLGLPGWVDVAEVARADEMLGALCLLLTKGLWDGRVETHPWAGPVARALALRAVEGRAEEGGGALRTEAKEIIIE